MAPGTGSDWSTFRRALESELTITGEALRAVVAKTREGHPVLVEYASGAVAWLVVRAWVCQQTEMDPELGLDLNGRLVYSSLSLIHGAYWLRMAVPLDSVEARDPARLVSLSVEAAKSLSPVRAEPPMGAGELFSHYAE